MVEFDQLLPIVGEFGRYQKFLAALLCFPFCIILAFIGFGQVFITVEADHWCRIPELDDQPNLTLLLKKQVAIPHDGNRFSQCSRYDMNSTELKQRLTIILERTTQPHNGSHQSATSSNGTLLPLLPCNHGWEFDTTQTYSSPVTEWEWVCQDSWKPYAAQSVFFVGCAIGCLLFGYISDTLGRVPSLMLSNGIGAAAGVATAFSQGFITFCLFRFVVGMTFDTCMMVFYILVLEYVGPSKRTLVSNVAFGIFFTLGTSSLPWIAYAIWDWRIFAIVTSAPIAAVLFLWLVIPESARWLLSKGKVNSALKIVEKMAAVNGRKIPPSTLAEFKNQFQEFNKEKKDANTATVFHLFKYPNLKRRTLTLFTVWFLIALCYDSHVRNTHNLGHSVFYAFTIASATELPAAIILVVLLDRLGRRSLSFLSLVIGGAVCLLIAAIPNDMLKTSAALAMSGRLMINISFNIGIQYAAELLPTSVRGQGVLTTHFIGFVGNIIGPFIVYLAKVAQPLPLLVIGALSAIAGFLCLLLPETLDQDLPETIEDAENFGKDQSFAWLPSCLVKRNESKLDVVKAENNHSERWTAIEQK